MLKTKKIFSDILELQKIRNGAEEEFLWIKNTVLLSLGAEGLQTMHIFRLSGLWEMYGLSMPVILLNIRR